MSVLTPHEIDVHPGTDPEKPNSHDKFFIRCTCGYKTTVTDECFISPIKERHMTLNK